MFYNFFHRYTIQVKFINDDEPRWSHFYRSADHATLSGARKELLYWNYYEWDFPAESRYAVFRIFDNKRNEVVY